MSSEAPVSGYVPGEVDELEEDLAQAMKDPAFAAAYAAAQRWWRRGRPGPLAVDGHAYQRRLAARRKRGRR